MSNRDILTVQAAGSLCLGLGMVLLVVTPLTALFLAFSASTPDPVDFAGGIASLALALITGAALTGCGVRLARAKHQTVVDINSLRTNWTLLVIIMAATGVVGLWLQPLLSIVAGVVLLALFMVRPAVIRLTN